CTTGRRTVVARLGPQPPDAAFGRWLRRVRRGHAPRWADRVPLAVRQFAELPVRGGVRESLAPDQPRGEAASTGPSPKERPSRCSGPTAPAKPLPCTCCPR